jgi:hypothetical protein
VVVFDDLHWGQPVFLDLVEHVADFSRNASILMICMARPELLDIRPAWGGGKLNAVNVLLEPLAPAETDRLIDELLSGEGIGQSLRDRILENAAEIRSSSARWLPCSPRPVMGTSQPRSWCRHHPSAARIPPRSATLPSGECSSAAASRTGVPSRRRRRTCTRRAAGRRPADDARAERPRQARAVHASATTRTDFAIF